MAFEQFNLPKALQKAIDQLGYQHPTPIQEKSFNVIMSGRDVMGIAQTGTGKTMAYLLPILKSYKFSNTYNPKIIILVPTRELVVQVVGEVEKLTEFMSVRTLGIYGGVNINTQKKAVYEGLDVLVATPGRAMDLALDNVLQLDEVQKLVIDEFDEMMNLGFRPQITSLLAMMRKKRQNILFSATMTDDVDEVLNDFFDFPEEITLAASGTPLEQIKQSAYSVANFNTKANLLTHLIQTQDDWSKILVFVNNKKIADMLFDKMEERIPGFFSVIHSNKSQNYRLMAMQSFEAGEVKGLITSDVMARGLDISNITHVINFEMPETPEHYMHRIGRTGRADASGTAISFVTAREEEIRVEIELLMEMEIPNVDFPEDQVEVSTLLIGPEKDKQKIKFLTKKPKIDLGAAFQEKKEKNKKINLGGPGKTKKKTGSVNRGLLRSQAAKKKKK